MKGRIAVAVCIAALASGSSLAQEKSKPKEGMSFFLATNPGKGGDLGGLAGADQRCQALAKEAGAGGKKWHAYLSAKGTDARDRIGKGPWYNAKGVMIAKSVDDLHQDPNINKQTALTANGEMVKGRGDKPNEHDMLTGSTSEGRAVPGDDDLTCKNWTSSGEGSAMLGHHDRMGLPNDPKAPSWNSSHPSKGCSMDALRSTGGAGYFYCFAAD